MSIQHSHAAPTVTASHELPTEHERIIQRLFKQVYSKGKLQDVKELAAPNYVGYFSGIDDVSSGPNGLKAHVTRLRSAFFGLSVEVDHVRSVGDTFEARWTARGRLERPFMGLDPTCMSGSAGDEPGGPVVVMSGVTVGTITDGQIRETETALDLDGLVGQVTATGRHSGLTNPDSVPSLAGSPAPAFGD